jgi:enoyl-CoA hydratase/carnithine racemase
MMKSYKTIRVEKREGIGYLSLNRPDVRNAFNQEMIDEIRDALSLINKDEEIRVLIITGEGKAFQAGADITELNLMKPMDLLRWNEGIVRINGALEKLRQPVIAAINGAAMGHASSRFRICKNGYA